MNEKSLANLIPNMGKGRPRGAKNKLRFNDIITDDKLQKVIEELYDIALNDKYAKNRIAAISLILDRKLGKVAVEVHQNITDVTPFKELVNNRRDTTDDDNDI